MKKGKIKQNIIDNDFDLNSDLDMGDFDFNMEPPKDDRKPITKLGAGILDGAKTGLRDTSFLKKTLKDVLPRGFGDSLDLSDKVGQNIRGIYDDSVKEIKPAIKDFKRVASKLIPKESSFVPKKVSDMIKRWEEESKSSSNETITKDTQRENFLNIQLTEAFKEQFSQAAKDRAESGATDKLQQGLELTRHRDLFGAINQSNLFLSRLDNYQSNVTLNYQKKTLEVHYRQLFATQDILEETRKSFALQTTSFEKIVKNTALPDFVKINNSEFRAQVFKNKFYESIQRGLFGGKDDYIEKFFKNVKDAAKDKVSGFANNFRSGLMGAEMGADTASSMGDMGGPGAVEMGGSVLGSIGAQTAGGYIAKKFVKPILDRNPGIQRVVNKAGDFANNSGRYLNDFKNSDAYEEKFDPDQTLSNKLFNSFMRQLQTFMPNAQSNPTFDKTDSSDMQSAYLITKRTDKSLNEIIPGYLARILREVQVLRTGDTSVELTKYDFDSSKFISASQSLLNAKNKLIPSKGTDFTHSSIDKIIDQLDPTGSKLSDTLKRQIKDTLLSSDAKNKNVSVYALIKKMDPKNVLNPNIKELLVKILDSKSKTATGVNDNLDKLLELLDTNDLSDDAKDEIKKKLLNNSVGERTANFQNLGNASSYSAKNGAQISDKFKKHFDSTDKTKQDLFKFRHNSLKDNFPDPTAYMQEMINLGRGEELEELGLLKEDGVSFNMDNYLEYFRGKKDLGETPEPGNVKPTSTKKKKKRVLKTSDINAKQDFKAFPGKSALDAIKKTMVSAWNYKSGKGDGGSHVGPMAQTVNKTMGEDAAPGSNKIDLVTMNGMTMSAIQELDKRQQATKASSKESSTGYNAQLDNHLLEIKGLLKEIKEINKASINLSLGNIPNFSSNINFSKFGMPGMDFDLKQFKSWYANEKTKAEKATSKAKQVFDDSVAGKMANAAYVGTNAIGNAASYAKDKATKYGNIIKDKVTISYGKSKSWYDNDIYDVWREGDKEPRLYSVKIKQGQYLNLKTKEIISHQTEINGPIVDKDNLANILITEEDLPFLYTRNPKSLATRALKTVSSKISSGIGSIKDAITSYTPPVLKFAKAIMESAWENTKLFANKTYSFIDNPVDVYVKGDKLPTLLAMVMKNGGYFSCMTNKPIIRLGEIDGPVKDVNGVTVLSLDQIKQGLVDHLGEPLKTPLDKIKNLLGDTLNQGARLGNTLWEGAKALGRGAAKSIGSLFSEFSIEINGKKSLSVLEEIRDILNSKYSKTKASKRNTNAVKANSESKPLNALERIVSSAEDIYVQGEDFPRITEVKLKLGHYKDAVTNKVITCANDIVNAIKDEGGKIVLSLPELSKLTYLDIKAKAFKKLELAQNSKIVNNIKTNISNATSMLPDKISDTISNAVDDAKVSLGIAKEKVMDVYVEGSKDPIMYASKLVQGLYRDKETNKPISHQSEIAGEVLDESNNTVINRQDLSKLITYNPATKRFQPLKLIGKALMSIIKPLWYFQTQIAPKMVAFNFRMLGKAASFGISAAKSILGIGPGKVKDVYVGNEPEPRLYAAKLKLGHYRLKATDKVIYHQDHIKGEVIDGDGEIVLAEDDLYNLKIYDSLLKIFNPFKLIGWAGKKIGQGIAFVAKGIGSGLKRIFTGTLGAAGKIIKTIFNALSKPGDVIVVGETTPTLLGKVMKAGGYISEKTRKPIEKVSDIDGTVLHAETGEVALSEDDIKKGLLDAKGKPIKPSLLSLIGGALGKLNKAFSLRVALPGSRKSIGGVTKKAETPVDRTNVLLTDIKDIFKNKFSPKKILGDKDGDGIRENSYEDIMRKKGFLTASKEKAKSAVATNKDKIIKKPGEEGTGFKLPGVLGKLYDKFFGKKDPAVEVAEDSLDQLTQIKYLLAKQALGNRSVPDMPDGPDRNRRGNKNRTGKGGIRGRLSGMGGRAALGTLGTVAGVATAGYGAYSAYNNFKEGNYGDAAVDSAMAIGGAAMTYGTMGGTMAGLGAAGSTALAIGGGVLSFISSPVVLGAAAVALTGYGLYKGYKMLTRGNLTPLEKIRYVQYGFDKTKTEHASKILELESYLNDLTIMDKGAASIKEKDFDVEKLLSIFGLDHKSDKDKSIFFEWYQGRFKPIYLTHCTALFAINQDKDLSKANSLKDPEKKKFIDAVKFPNGPYDFNRLPLTDLGADYKVSSKLDVAKVIEEVLAELKLDGKKGPAKKELLPDPSKSVIDQSSIEEDPALRDQSSLSNQVNNDKLKLPNGTVSGESTVTKEMLLGNDKVNALDAIKYKAYGLVELDASKVRSLKQLESEIIKEVIYSSKATATWEGNPIKILEKVSGIFGVSDIYGKGANDWLVWFKDRFLPVYLSYLTGYMVLTGKASVGNDSNVLKPNNQVDLGKIIAGLSEIWTVNKSPWPNYKLNIDPASVQENVEFLSSVVKAEKLQQDKKSAPQPKQDPKLNTPDPKDNSNLGGKKVDDIKVENPIKTEEKPAPVSTGASENGLTPANPPMAEGEVSDGAGALNAIKYGKGASLNRVNPALTKQFYGMVQEYNEKTKKSVGVNDGFRTFEQQSAEYKKNPKKAARPGSSMHEFGLAIDVDSKTLDEMESLGLMKKYGLTRPVGGEPWHLEPAGVQTRADLFKNNSGSATAAIEAGIGRGGGGMGTVAGTVLGTRNAQYASKLLGAPIEPNVKTQLAKDISERSAKTLVTAQSIKPEMDSKDPKAVKVSGKYDAPKVEVPTDGENKPAAVTTAGQSDLSVKPKLPSDPTVKIPDPTGSGFSGQKATVEAAAKMVGVDPNLALSTVALESDFNPNAAAKTSSAKGLYQFTNATWEESLSKHGNKYGLNPSTSAFDPKANSILGAQYLKTNTQTLNGKVKRDLGPTELYLAHFLGPSGAAKFLNAMENSGETSAAEVMPNAAKSNTAIFYNNGKARTVNEVYALMDKKVRDKAKIYGVTMPAEVSNKDTKATASSEGNTSSIVNATANQSVPKTPNEQPGPVAAPSPMTVAASQPKPSVSDSMNNVGKSPLNDAYGFNPALANKKEDVSKNAISKDLFKTTEGLLGESLDVEKQMLGVLKNIFGVMNNNAGSKPADKPVTQAPKTPQAAPYSPPRVPVPMMKSIA